MHDSMIHPRNWKSYRPLVAMIVALGSTACSFAQTATIDVVSPNGGEQFAAGDSTTIEWRGALLRDPIRLSYTVDGGATWTKEADGVLGTQYRWRVPDVTTGD